MASDTASDVGRKRDYVYRLLVAADTGELDTCSEGVCGSLSQHEKCHPCISELVQATQKSAVVRRAVVLFAMLADDAFMQYLMERHDTCAVSLSLFRHEHLGSHVQWFLNGEGKLEDFVVNATVDYICC
jgi:hypothetical protein